MPTIFMFYGIHIRMFFQDIQKHHVPHIQADCQGKVAAYSILDGTLLASDLPPNKHKLGRRFKEGRVWYRKVARVVSLIIFCISTLALSACVTKDAEHSPTTAFEFNQPSGFAPISMAPEEGILRFYGNQSGDSVNVSHYGYLQNRELTREVCDELVSSFNDSDLRASLKASSASLVHYEVQHGVRSCYYMYEFHRAKGVSHVEYTIHQKTIAQSYAITAVYDTKSPDIVAIQRAMRSFRIK